MAGITLDNLTKVYDDGTRAVRSLDLDISDGELMVFVGPSGCGKTTALRMIAGLEEVTDGEIRIGDEIVNDLPAEGARHRDGLPELRALSAHDGLRQHGVRPRACGGSRSSEIERRVTEAAKVLGLAERAAAQAGAALRRPAAAGRDGPGDRARAATSS